eukprot:340858-Pyramimonas_sp.AAC.1
MRDATAPKKAMKKAKAKSAAKAKGQAGPKGRAKRKETTAKADEGDDTDAKKRPAAAAGKEATEEE